jgi:hypothetical protein
MVDGKMVKAEDTIKLLGVSFDRKLTTKPHAQAMLVAVKQRAAVIARLVNHVPRGKYLRQLATGLVNGKLGHALAACATPRLPATGGEVANPSTLYHQIQVAYNRVARLITGIKLRDRVSVPDLLERAGIPSVHGMVVSAVAMETWNCRHSSDSGNGAKNFVGAMIFDQGRAVKPTRAAAAGMTVVPLRGRDVEFIGGTEGGGDKTIRKACCKKSCSKISTQMSEAAYLARDPVNAAREAAELAREVSILARDVADQETDFPESSLSFFLHPERPGRKERIFLRPLFLLKDNLEQLRDCEKEAKNIAQRVKDANAMKVQSFAKVRRTKHRPWEDYHFCECSRCAMCKCGLSALDT